MEGIRDQLNDLTLTQPVEEQQVPKETLELRAKLDKYIGNLGQKIQTAEVDLALLGMECKDLSMIFNNNGFFTAHTSRHDSKKQIQTLLVQCNQMILEIAGLDIDDDYKPIFQILHTDIQTISREVALVWQDYQDRLAEELLEQTRSTHQQDPEAEEEQGGKSDDEVGVEDTTAMFDEMDIDQ